MSTNGTTASAANETTSEAQRHDELWASCAITGRKINCPVAPAAVRMPITSPRLATNQRLAMVAAKTIAIDPVPSPISTPQVSTSCQPWFTITVSPLPAATSANATLVTRRMPNRSISAAANGAITPYKMRLTLTALDMRVRGQPNSSSSGTISTPGALRKPADPSKAMNATTATHHAGWMGERRSISGATGGFRMGEVSTRCDPILYRSSAGCLT